MQLRHPVRATSLLGLAILWLPLSALADDCFQPSPNRALQGDDYYSVARSDDPTDETLEQLNQFIDDIEGDWEGPGFIIECFGNSNSPDARGTDAEIDAKIASATQGAFRIDYEVKRLDDKTRKLENITLDVSASNQTFSVTGSSAIVSEKFRIRNANGSSRLMERIIDMSHLGNSLEVQVTLYVNGYLSATQSWQLRR
ncbi:MAG: hypothetical protein AAGA91_07165 [Pseudomonadota bacterium]